MCMMVILKTNVIRLIVSILGLLYKSLQIICKKIGDERRDEMHRVFVEKLLAKTPGGEPSRAINVFSAKTYSRKDQPLIF
jgi:hypothetical protein